MASWDDKWLDNDAGPFVRPYAVTKGRTVPATDQPIGLIDLIVATGDPQFQADLRLSPEHRQLLARARRPATLVDLASDVDLPVGVVRVLLGDLHEQGFVRVLDAPSAPGTDQRLLNEVLDGLKAL